MSSCRAIPHHVDFDWDLTMQTSKEENRVLNIVYAGGRNVRNFYFQPMLCVKRKRPYLEPMCLFWATLET